MAFSKISLTGYKNYEASTFNFTERIIGICGLNGKGKTNLLDAINYLCFTKSYFTRSDLMNVHFGGAGFRIEGEINGKSDGASPSNVVCIYRGLAKKEFYLDDVAYEKFSHHIGKFPCVMIAPDDIQVIAGNSDERRKFLDTLISQLDGTYLSHLITYNKLLQQRNSFLKNIIGKNYDRDLLATLDAQLIRPANYIHTTRIKYCAQLVPLIHQFYAEIAGAKEALQIEYVSQLSGQDFAALLKSSREKDLATQRTNTGIHKDDLHFLLQGNPFKQTASQGQRKSLLFGCKLAEFEILKETNGIPPLLLLDDIFEKLDEQRTHNLLHYVCKINNGQVFITDTHRDRLEQSLVQFDEPLQIIELT